MENSPRKPEDESPEIKPSKKKKKSAEALGVFAVDPEPLKPAAGKDETDSIWDKLTLTKRRGGQTEETVPLSQALHQEEASRSPETDEEHLAELTVEETQVVAREFIAAEKQVEPAKINEEEQAEGAAIFADEMVEVFRNKILSGGETVEQAFEETMQDLAGPAAPEAVSEPDEPNGGREHAPTEMLLDPDVAAPLAQTDASESSPVSSVPVEKDTPLRDREAPPEGVGLEPGDDTSPSATRNIDGGPVPPIAGFAQRYNQPPGGGSSPAHAPSEKEKIYVPYYNDSDVVGGLLIGGIIGYLIGRRRGRIKTERKLRPIQKKLEKQVAKLKEDIQQKEFYIRKVARQQAQDRQRIRQMEQIHDRPDKKSSAETRAIAPEANQLHGKKVSPERIGQVLVAAGRSNEARPAQNRRAEKELERIKLKSESKSLATMNRAELLRLSEKVTVENTTLRQVYETHLVSEQGLRRLVEEYVRGGDVQRALRHELVEHEIDFERDPILRDKTRPSAETTIASSATLSELLQKADAVSEAHSDDELAVLKARQAHHETQRQRQQKSRHILDISMITAIAVLFVIVVMLLLEGR